MILSSNGKNENVESVLSYATSGTGFAVSSLLDWTGTIQFMILILSLIVLIVRLAHDALRFYRYLTKQEK